MLPQSDARFQPAENLSQIPASQSGAATTSAASSKENDSSITFPYAQQHRYPIHRLPAVAPDLDSSLNLHYSSSSSSSSSSSARSPLASFPSSSSSALYDRSPLSKPSAQPSTQRPPSRNMIHRESWPAKTPPEVHSPSHASSSKSPASLNALAPFTQNSDRGVKGVDEGDSSHGGLSSTADQSSILGPAPLRRNMACLTCRKRKLRCDAVKPVCGTCAKSRAVAAAANHPAPIPDGDCVYGEPSKKSKKAGKGSTEDGSNPVDEEEMGAAESSKKGKKRKKEGAAGSENELELARIAQLEAQVRRLESMLAEKGRSSAGRALSFGESSKASDPAFWTAPNSAIDMTKPVAEPDPLLELLWGGYPSDLPSPDTILHLSEIFFTHSPYRNCVYKSAFMVGLTLPPRHPGRPHMSLLHAVLAISAPLSPHFRPKRKRESDLVRRRDDHFGSIPGLTDPDIRPKASSEELSFAEFHLTRARIKTEKALMTEHRTMNSWLQILQALTLIIYTLRLDGHLLEAFLLCPVACRLTTPTGLTRMPSRHDRGKEWPPCYLEPPASASEEHERRSFFWHTWLVDAYTSGVNHLWQSGLDDDSPITTVFPIKMADFQAGLDPPPNPQSLLSDDLFTNLENDDDFLLHLKSGVLCKRVYKMVSIQSTKIKKNLRSSPAYLKLEKDILDFLARLPPYDFTGRVSMDLLVACLNANLAITMLYKGHKTRPVGIDRTSEQYKKARQGILSILRIAYQLNASSFDLAFVHFRAVTCFTVAAQTICHEINCLLKDGGSVKDTGFETSEEDELVELFGALDAILSVLRRAEEKVACAVRAVEIISRFRSEGWSTARVDRSFLVVGVVKSLDEQDEEEKQKDSSSRLPGTTSTSSGRGDGDGSGSSFEFHPIGMSGGDGGDDGSRPLGPTSFVHQTCDPSPINNPSSVHAERSNGHQGTASFMGSAKGTNPMRTSSNQVPMTNVEQSTTSTNSSSPPTQYYASNMTSHPPNARKQPQQQQQQQHDHHHPTSPSFPDFGTNMTTTPRQGDQNPFSSSSSSSSIQPQQQQPHQVGPNNQSNGQGGQDPQTMLTSIATADAEDTPFANNATSLNQTHLVPQGNRIISLPVDENPNNPFFYNQSMNIDDLDSWAFF
ncbi:hypothetical protein IE53DRAFT_369392 [Violaceomyces palustris]|uniref:Uncharacterized protein n=1 Tax=Violaceomyces palustris TaxID=1673888 RepID=A0ACD0NVV8_9BASI|nr:hypothetical protein IE53DRAFT_369392 [Violaceomyces palustris]